jgi:hypothetical protein
VPEWRYPVGVSAPGEDELLLANGGGDEVARGALAHGTKDLE